MCLVLMVVYFCEKKFPLHILKIIFPHMLGMFFKGFIR